jgi:hypothetical protein
MDEAEDGGQTLYEFQQNPLENATVSFQIVIYSSVAVFI